MKFELDNEHSSMRENIRIKKSNLPPIGIGLSVFQDQSGFQEVWMRRCVILHKIQTCDFLVQYLINNQKTYLAILFTSQLILLYLSRSRKSTLRCPFHYHLACVYATANVVVVISWQKNDKRYQHWNVSHSDDMYI